LFFGSVREEIGVLGDVLGQELKSDKATERSVLGFTDDTHSAAELFDDAVVRDGLADHWRESYVGETGKSIKAMGLLVAQQVSC
jgi:hypothetical protein